MSERIDWTTTDGCVHCDEHGPYLPGPEEGARNLHRLWHAVTEVYLTPIVRALDWLDRKRA